MICPPRPGGDHPERALVVVDPPGVAAILDRIAADIDELARARRADDLAAAAVLPAGALNAAGAWPSRTWISGSSAAVRRSRHPRNDPGTPTRPSGTAAGILKRELEQQRNGQWRELAGKNLPPAATEFSCHVS